MQKGILKAAGFYPQPRFNYCGADSGAALVIDPEGKLYKCCMIQPKITNLGDVFVLFGGIQYMAKTMGKEIVEIKINIAQLEPNEWIEYGPYNFEKNGTLH